MNRELRRGMGRIWMNFLLKLKDLLLAVAVIAVGLIFAWYCAIRKIPWGLSVINLGLLLDLAIAFYIPAMVWGVLRGNRPGRWLIGIPILLLFHVLWSH